MTPLFLTSALDGGEWSTSRSGCFAPGERTAVTIGWEICWLPEPVWTVWTLWGREKSLTPAGNRTPVVHPAIRRYTD
jgi:hypothetical protein